MRTAGAALTIVWAGAAIPKLPYPAAYGNDEYPVAAYPAACSYPVAAYPVEIGETALTIGAATGTDVYAVATGEIGETVLTIGAATGIDEYPV